jgi:formylglycine-generating enzyme required for sulfatase activity
LSTQPTQRARRSPVRIILYILGLAAILTAGGFYLWWSSNSADREREIEAAAQASREAVLQEVAAQAREEIPGLGLDAASVAMARVPAGSFEMGSLSGETDEEPVHTVTLDAYYIDVFEVTNGIYQACVEAGVCHRPFRTSSQRRDPYYGNPQYAHYPVVFVSYPDAGDFCAWRGARLPTEAEWEKAARGGLEGADYPWGNEDPVCTPGASNGANHDRCSPAETWPVGSFAPNGYGLYDMAGNVWEWVADYHNLSYDSEASTNNPTGPETGLTRVLRGGAWNLTLYHMRAANRLRNYPVDSNYNIGFRCARTP